MACHTLSESARLTGKSRRTIQRYVKSGKLSAKKDSAENPSIDTSELIRVFGELSHPVKEELSHSVAVTDNDNIANVISRAIIEANKPLHEEIRALTEQVKHLTYRLDKPKVEPEKAVENIINEPVFMRKEKPTNYLDDIPTFGSKK